MSKKNIYLINQEFTNLYKIGITKKDPSIRLKELQTGNGNNLILIKVFETSFNHKLERSLHLHYKTKKVNSEWFELNEDDLNSFNDTCFLYENNFSFLKKNSTLNIFI